MPSSHSVCLYLSNIKNLNVSIVVGIMSSLVDLDPDFSKVLGKWKLERHKNWKKFAKVTRFGKLVNKTFQPVHSWFSIFCCGWFLLNDVEKGTDLKLPKVIKTF